MDDTSGREQLIRQKIIEEEDKEQIATNDARLLVREVLLKKDYTEEDIIADLKFTISTGNITDNVSIDYLIHINGVYLIAIKCTMAVDSRERHALAFARAVMPYQIPYCIVTDGITARLYDSHSGSLVSESLDAIPSKDSSLDIVKTLQLMPCPAERLEREKRILLAFETTACRISNAASQSNEC